MSYLDKKFHEICKEELIPIYGFKKYRNTYYRIINDVFQSFTLHKSVSGFGCTVEFAILPLCTGNLLTKSSCGSDHLKMFEGKYEWFFYNKNDTLSIEACLEEIFKYMKKYLIVYFEQGNTCANAYSEVLNFHQKFLRKDAIVHMNELYYFALKSEMYAEAIEHLSTMKKAAIDAFDWNKNFFTKKDLLEFKKRLSHTISNYDDMILNISARNMEYINALISQNEKTNLRKLGITL